MPPLPPCYVGMFELQPNSFLVFPAPVRFTSSHRVLHVARARASFLACYDGPGAALVTASSSRRAAVSRFVIAAFCSHG